MGSYEDFKIAALQEFPDLKSAFFEFDGLAERADEIDQEIEFLTKDMTQEEKEKIFSDYYNSKEGAIALNRFYHATREVSKLYDKSQAEMSISDIPEELLEGDVEFVDGNTVEI